MCWRTPQVLLERLLAVEGPVARLAVKHLRVSISIDFEILTLLGSGF